MKNKLKPKPKEERKLITHFNGTPEDRKARQARLIALLHSPLFNEDVEEQRETGEALQKALAEAHGY